MALSQETPEQTWRIIDASLDRIGEGLRLLEDMARFLLNDATLTQQLKNMRHELVSHDWSLNRQLLQARQAGADIGADIKGRHQAEERDLPSLIVANARRVQESLRVIEELAKMPSIQLDPEMFKKARFNIYTIERDLLSRLLRKDKIKHIHGYYAIIDTQFLAGRSHREMASALIGGGARVVQLRDKALSKSQLLAVAHELKKLCVEHDVLFIVNDHLELALAADADGLHLGQEDLPISIARRLLPIDKILGCSVTTVEEAATAQSEGADYIAAGAIYPTTTKEGVTVIGLEGLRLIKKAVKLPLVAIGGITLDKVAEVISAGADSVAIIRAIHQAESPEETARQIIATIESQSGQNN